MPIEQVTVIGAGAWGTALAQVAAMAGRQVSLLVRDPGVADEINLQHTNSRHLGAQRLSDWITASTSFTDADLVILATPAQATRHALQGHHGALSGLPVVLTAKGLEQSTLKRQSEILFETIPDAVPFVLSGPSFASDVAAGRPTAVTLAGDDPDAT
ncbi:MAG: 2-dehydropantoate 2-reductase N-terminal domain-containing protein, partial [Devosia sp.]